MKTHCSYVNDKGQLVTVKIPRDATPYNGPMLCGWRHYDCNGSGYDMYQDSWGRPVGPQ